MLEMSGTLLSDRAARKSETNHAFFRSENDIPASIPCRNALNRQENRAEKPEKVGREIIFSFEPEFYLHRFRFHSYNKYDTLF